MRLTALTDFRGAFGHGSQANSECQPFHAIRYAVTDAKDAVTSATAIPDVAQVNHVTGSVCRVDTRYGVRD